MRRDDGTTGILQYMEQLSWMIFLKVFEDVEERFEQQAEFKGTQYSPIIEKSYRWSSWAGVDYKKLEVYFSEEELESVRKRNEHILLAFIDTKLFPYLQALRGTPEKDRIASIFQEIRGNRMKRASNMWDVISRLNDINFNNTEDSHTLSQVYEELLLRMGREGGVAGEFYTPRPIVKLMVQIINPQIGERVLDPFCGSCGFLIESFNHTIKSKELTIEDHEKLLKETFYGQEKKPLPYLIGIMNSILHGLLNPNLIRTNTLEENIRNISERQKFDVILTNPPFGGKEGKHVRQNFPYSSSKTEILALQYVMKKLRKGGRCGIVVPEGILFNTTEKAFVNTKKDLLENYRLHTIISLPSGVFANVTATGQGPKTSLLFFEKTGSTEEIWYYDYAGYSENVLKKKYSKVNPVHVIDLKHIIVARERKEKSDWSWLISLDEIIKNGYDLTTRNPNQKDESFAKSPLVILESLIKKEKEINRILIELKDQIG